MITYVLCGTGWRAEFYMRLAALIPHFKLSAIYTRSEERKALFEEKGFNVYTSLDEALKTEHDFVIVSSGNEGFVSLLKELHERGEKIVTETSFLKLSDEELDYIYANIPGFTLEQYSHTPLYASIYKAFPLIGTIDSVYLSALHNHHAASIAHLIFNGKRIKKVKTLADHRASCIKTGSRAGLLVGEGIEEYKRKITSIEYESGEIFINDFSSNQYHSEIIPSTIEIRGEKGTITESSVCYIGDDGYPHTIPFIFNRASSKINGALTLSHVTLGDKTLYTNPYYPININDDEIAIALMIEELASSGWTYTIKEAIEDAKLGKLL